MAIPPIISNLPIFKSLKTAEPAQKQEVATSPATTEDVVEISGAARERLENVRTLTEQEAPEVSAQTAKELADSDLALGLDPSFDRK